MKTISLFVLFLCLGIGTTTRAVNPLEGDLVKVSSSYYNENAASKSSSVIQLNGRGLLFSESESGRLFVLTASHVSQGTVKGSLKVISNAGQKYTITSSYTDNLNDLEVIEVANESISDSPNFNYHLSDISNSNTISDRLCGPLKIFRDEDRMVYSKFGKTKVFIPTLSDLIFDHSHVKLNDFYDRFSLSSMRSFNFGMHHKEYISNDRINGIFGVDSSVIDNPVRAGMSGLPILAEVSDRWDDVNERTSICVIGVVQAYHRIIPRSYGASPTMIQSLVRRALLKNQIQDSTVWKMRQGVTYRTMNYGLDQEAVFNDNSNGGQFAGAGSSSFFESGSGGSADGGSGGSADGGSGGSADGGQGNEKLKPGSIAPGMKDGEHILYYKIGDLSLYANLFAYQLLKSARLTDPIKKIPYPLADKDLHKLLKERLDNAKKYYPIDQDRRNKLMTWTKEDIEAKKYFFSLSEQPGEVFKFTKWDSIEGGESVYKLAQENINNPWPEPCLVDEQSLKEQMILVRLINGDVEKSANAFHYFEVNKNGQLLQYYDGTKKKWIKAAAAPSSYLPFKWPGSDTANGFFIDVKGLFFSDLENAFKLNQQGINRQRQIRDQLVSELNVSDPLTLNWKEVVEKGGNENGWIFSAFQRQIRLIDQYVDKLPLVGPFNIIYPQRDAVTTSLTGNILGFVSHIVVTSEKTGMSWPLICVSKKISYPK